MASVRVTVQPRIHWRLNGLTVRLVLYLVRRWAAERRRRRALERATVIHIPAQPPGSGVQLPPEWRVVYYDPDAKPIPPQQAWADV